MSGITRFFALLVAFFTMIFTPGKTFDRQETVNVMTYNISYADLTATRMDALKQQIEAVSPDSFGMQEVKDKTKKYFADNLTDYDYYVVSDGDTGNETYNMICWQNAKFKLKDSGFAYLSETPDVVSKGWDARHVRMMQWVMLENPKTGFRYVHANVHLDHVGENARKESLKLIDSILKGFGCPVIVSGDFNCRYTGSELPVFMNLGWQNTINLSGVNKSTDTFHNYDGSDVKHSPIDHIFVKSASAVTDWTVHREQYNGSYPSDHFALSVKLTFDFTITAKQNYELI